MGFAQNLAYLMQRNAMTKYQLAKEVGCHQTSITNWLENGTMPQKRTIDAVASVFGISSVDLCGDDLPQCKQKNTPTSEGERNNKTYLDKNVDAAYFRVMQSAKDKGYTPEDIQMAMDFIDRARKRDQS